MFDGHGGTAAAQWLQQHLYEDVVAKLDAAFLQADPAAQPVEGRAGVVRPTHLQQRLIDVFQQADNELLQHLLGALATGAGAAVRHMWCVPLPRACHAVGNGVRTPPQRGTPCSTRARAVLAAARATQQRPRAG